MSVAFRGPVDFVRETAAITVGAAAAGVATGLSSMTGLPLVVVVGGAMLLGASVGAAVTRPVPPGTTPKTAWRVVLGVAGGTMAAVGFGALALRVGGVDALLAGGSVGGLALGLLLGADEGKGSTATRVLGAGAAALAGGVGALAVDNAAAFAASEGANVTLTSATLAGAWGLWIAAAAGLRRLHTQRDPLRQKADDVLEGLVDPLRARVLEGLATWGEIEVSVASDESMGDDARAETTKQARLVIDSVLETARTWAQIQRDLQSPAVKSVDEKLTSLEGRLAATSDDITRGHLTRALAALTAQKSAIDGLKTGLGRAEAAVEAQLALLERLRLAVAQHRVSDCERFQVELSAVAEQAGRLSDDLDTLAAALVEAETLADRRALADLERGARRALGNIAPPVAANVVVEDANVDDVNVVVDAVAAQR